MRYWFNACEVDTRIVELKRDGEVVPLEPLVFRTLTFLLEHADRVVSKDELLLAVWPGKVVSDATIANAVKLVRRAVGDSGETQAVIRTVRGSGFRFVADLVVAEHAPRTDHAPADPQPVPGAMPTLPAMPSIALLGFQQLDGAAAGDLFAEGLAVDLNAQLARLPGLFVIAYDSARRFPPDQRTLQEIGLLLGVRYLLFGTAQRAAGRIRITVNLVEAASQRVVWAEHFDRSLDDVFAVQDDVVRSVVAALLPELERAEMERVRLLPTANLDAWECYHRAMWHSYRFTAQDSAEARALLLRALAMDPSFARASAGLSFNHYLHAFLDTDDTAAEHIRRALDYGEQAVALESRDAMSHWVLGRARFLARDHDRALVALDRALEANPNYAQGTYARGFVRVHSGLTREAVADLDGARRLSPFDPLLFAMKSSRAIALAIEGDFDSASRWAVEATEEPNAHFHIHAVAAACLQLAGRREASEAAVGRVLRQHPRYAVSVFERSFPYRDPKQQTLISEALVAAGIPRAAV